MFKVILQVQMQTYLREAQNYKYAEAKVEFQ